MTEPHEMLSFIEKFHSRIKKFCEPLVHHFGVNEFVYAQETTSGQSKSISLNLDWVNYYYSEKLYLINPLHTHPDNHREGLILINMLENESVKNFLDQAKTKFSVHLGFCICNKISDGTEFFVFGLTSSKSIQIMRFFNETILIRAFIKRFKEEFSSKILDLNEYCLDMNHLKGSSYQKLHFDLFPPVTKKEEFLENIGLEIPVSLTLKEIEVVKYLLKGLSAPKIADNLFISSRTVEHHLERIKDKLDCTSKAELIQKIQSFDSFGLLSS